MKKLLLATTILGMSAGFASAEAHSTTGIAFSGTATAGFASVNGAAFETYTTFELGVAATGQSDSGLAFGASFAVIAGESFDFDGTGSSFSGESGEFGDPEVFISGDFGRIAFSHDGYADYHADDDDEHDVEYTHTVAGINIGVRADVDGIFDPSVQLGYTAGAIALGLNYDVDGDDGEAFDVSVDYTAGAISFGLGLDNDEVTTVSVGYAANGISAGIEINSNDEYTLSAGYEVDALTLAFEIDESDVWEATGEYDLGGGLTVEAGLHESESAFLGARMAF